MDGGLVLFGAIIAAIGIGYAWWTWRMRSRLLAAPVVGPGNAAAHSGEVIVTGIARGKATTSPWTGREGLIFSADELVEDRERASDGSTRRRTTRRSLGIHLEQVELADPGGSARLAVRYNDTISLRHFPKMTTAMLGDHVPSLSIGPISLGSSDRSRVEEIVVSDGDQVWVLGRVEANADGTAHLGGKQIWSAKDPERMTSQLTLKALAGAVAGAVGSVLAVVGLAG